MARQSKARSTRDRASRGRQPKNEGTRNDQVPNIYQEMLDEAEARDPAQFHADRPIKRRRVGDIKAIPLDSPLLNDADVMLSRGGVKQVQTVYDSASSDESDVEWEDVDLPQPTPGPSSAALAVQGDDEPLEITLGQEPQSRKKAIQRRKPVTAAEKNVRLDVHKTHLLCLLSHVSIRNRWCSDDELQKFLRRMLPKRILALLNPDESKPQFTRSTTFIDGLNQAGDIFNRRFRVTKPGLKRAHWAESQEQLKQKVESIMSNAEVFLSREDFISQAKMMQGSRDFGAQLFCALLRSAAIESRLVCSLQVLPFSGTVKDMTPSKNAPEYIVVSSDDYETSTDERKKVGASPSISRARRLGRPEFSTRPIQSSLRLGSDRTLRESSYPVFWVEAFNEAMQKWVPIDPLVTKTLGKPLKLEPPASDPYNMMNYVVGFEDDASVRDITRRYAKAFNAKTRKLRVESTRHGQRWWDQALKTYEKPFFEDRDELEISELTSKSAAEPMPRNILDFKDHPVYALERHLRRNEVIFPKRVIGHVGLSKSTVNSDNLDSVYRRSDVHIVRSADKWYRLGRDVKVGEQPLKHVTAIRPKSGIASDDETDEPEQTALYAEHQTDIYQPPPVVQGRIPKNAYGNLDVYVPSMVPPGAVHIKQPEAARAARLLAVDYADAVTGFDFKGRRGTAVFGGIVIALEYQEALEEVLRGFADDRQQALFEARSAEALRLWRLFLVKLRIAERVKGYADEEERLDASASDMGFDEDAGGGFFPDPDQPTQSPPRVSFGSNPGTNITSHRTDAFDGPADAPDDEDEALGGGGVPDETSANGPADLPIHEDANTGGGFISDDLIDDGPAVPSTTTRSPNKTKMRGPPNVPRYELIVVPNKPDSIAQERALSTHSENPQDLEGSSEQAAIAVDSSTNGDSKSTSVVAVSRPPSPPKIEPNPPPPVDSDSEIEKGSLLSEDPEDEDAVPDWLMFE